MNPKSDAEVRFIDRRIVGNRQNIALSHQSRMQWNKVIWIHKEMPEGKFTRTKIIAKVVKIGINTLYKMFANIYGGKL